ncbi:MAG TPA: hypothetical protein VL359_06570, partial [bacterium]|nr:hypothetical protein [bacterium]
QAELEGIRAWRCTGWEEALAGRFQAGRIPLLVRDDLDDLAGTHPTVLVDARMRKRQEPPVQLHQAPLVLGIGPGFVAGMHVHAVIESNWGPALGTVLWHGQAQAYTGEHRLVQGKGRERYIYAPGSGRFRTDCTLLQAVRAGQVVGWVDEAPLRAEIGGVLRGLASAGLQVSAGAKVAEIDPTGDPSHGRGIGERPRAIARGVLQAIVEKWPELAGAALGGAGAP